MSARGDRTPPLPRAVLVAAIAVGAACQPVAPAGVTPQPVLPDSVTAAVPPPARPEIVPHPSQPQAPERPAAGSDTLAGPAADSSAASGGANGRPGSSVRPEGGSVAAPAQRDSAPRAPRAPVDVSTAQRFEILDVGDSTLRFLARRAPWLEADANGIVVDPRRRDVLVARFEVVRRLGDTATALVTGQTQRVVLEHVALVPRPTDTTVVVVETAAVRPRRVRFWEGVLTGLAVGLLGALAVR